MYISYDKLWAMLAERRITKTELCELTGISTRTVANMTKGRDVTLYSLGRICEALHCEVADIVTFTSKPEYRSLFDAYKASDQIGQDEFCKYFKVDFGGKTYDIAVTKRTANRYSVITCSDRSVVWAQMPFSAMAAGNGYGESIPEFELTVHEKQAGVIRIIVISGKPNHIKGLDEGIFRSSRNPGNDTNVHVMSTAAFKIFDPDQKS